MSQDPYSNYGSKPDNPYDNSQQPNPYGPPQVPYGSPPENPYGPPPQNPYGQPPENPYGPPPQNPSQSPYGPPQQPYPMGPGYQEPYGNVVAASPLPLSEALQQLPSQYMRVLTKPSAQVFAEEKGKAAWDIIWVQLLIYAVVGALLSYLVNMLMPNRYNFSGNATTLPSGTMQAIMLGTSLGMIVLLPLGFFISEGIYYLIARAFRGTGTFLEQCYTATLITVPVGIISLFLSFIPILGSLAAFALSIYAIVLHVFSFMAVHRLSGGKATLVVLLPVIVLFVLACVIGLIFAFALASMMRH